MAFYCIDYLNGSNVTGDGTASLPWATIEHGETQINGGTGYVLGDEMRIAGSTKSALLGTVTRTSSTSSTATFSTSTDLRGTLSVGDYIQLVSGDTYPGTTIEQFTWYVSSISASQIVLLHYNFQYTMFGQPKSYGIYKINDPVTFDVNAFSGYYLDKPNEIATSFDPFSDSVTISGGWDPATFTSKTAYGKTVFGRTGTYQATAPYPYGAVFYPSIGLNGLLFKDMSFSRVYANYWAVSGQWNGGCNWTNISCSYTIENHTGTPLASTYNRIYDGCAIQNGAAFDCEPGGPKAEFKNGWIAGGALTAPVSQFQTAMYNEVVDFSNNICLTIGGLEFLGVYSTISPYNPGGFINIDFATTTVLSPNTSLGYFLASGSYQTSSGVQNVTVPSAFLGNYPTTAGFESVMDYTWPGQIKLTTDNVDASIQWKSGKYVVGAYPSTLTDTTTGLTWDVLGRAFSRLNTLDKDTGLNCIELKPIKNVCEAWFLPIRIKKGDNLELTIKAKIKGSQTSTAPTFYVGGTSASTITNYDGFPSLDVMTLISGSNFTNTAWQTNTYSISNALSTVTGEEFFASITISDYNLTNGNSLLIDQVTWSVS
jgi:hypothetical protein